MPRKYKSGPYGLRAELIPEGDWIRVISAYDPEYVESLKAWIPSSERRWSPHEYCWRVRATYKDALTNILKEHGFVIVESRKSSSQPRSSPTSSEPTDWVKAIFDVCPSQHLERLWRGLQNVFHPDIGGDTNIAKRINTEYQKRSK